MKTVIEPFRIKSIERIRQTSKDERIQLIKDSNYNVTLLRSDDVLIDLLTDSGTSAMSSNQWSAMQYGDESYVRSPSFYRFKESVIKLTGFKHIIPTHQGRSAERILASIVSNKNSIVPNNSHFDTTRANFESFNATALDLVIDESKNSESLYPFKGNIDIEKLENLLKVSHKQIPLVMLTVTNNSVGGQPVSMENIRTVNQICSKYRIPLFLDACRFSENAYFIKTREPGYKAKSITDIVNEMFSYADGMTMSAKKDALSNTGGCLAMNNDVWAEKAMNELLLSQGFVTYGGLSGRDLDAIAIGLHEAVDEEYLKYRIRSIEYLGDALRKAGIPVLRPFGGHAIFVDAEKMFPHIPLSCHPGQRLNVELYIEAGIRACEISSIKLDRTTDDYENIEKSLVRLAFPRRVYTQSHMDYIVEAFVKISMNKLNLSGFDMTHKPHALNYYSAKFLPVSHECVNPSEIIN